MRLFLLGGLVLLAACSSPAAPPADPPAADPARDEVLALLARADTAAFRMAFASLQGRTYTRYDRYEHHTEDTRTGLQIRVMHLMGDSTTVVRDEREGVFETDSALRAVFAPPGAHAAPDLSAFALPRDPAYLQPRHFGTYAYRLLPDTLLGGARARVVEVAVRPDADEPPPVRRARYWLEATTDRILAVELVRADGGLGFSEASRYYLRIRPLGDTFVPEVGRFSTTTRLPFRAPRRIARQVAFYGFGA